MVATVDDTIAIWVATHRFAPLDPLFVGLGTIERLGAIWIALALVIALVRGLGVGRALLVALGVGAVTFLADAASFGLKDLVQRPRPFAAHPRQIESLYVVHSSSFPAGHAATAFAGATVLAVLAPRWRLVFFALAAAIGFSRVYVGDHYPGDVVAGAMLGALVALAALAAVRAVAGRRYALRPRPPVETSR